MLRQLRSQRKCHCQDLISSKLYDELTFYTKFIKDLENSLHEAIIENPFVTSRRFNQLLPILLKLKNRKVRITVITKDPQSQDNEYMKYEAASCLSELQHKGIHVVFKKGHHRKIAIIDRSILWEGSLNILSQCDSIEIMRRVESIPLAWKMIQFTDIDKLII